MSKKYSAENESSDLLESIVQVASTTLELDVVVQTIASWLVDHGFAPGRVNLAVLTLHPALAGIAFGWSNVSRAVVKLERPWGFLDSREHAESPLQVVMMRSTPLRLRLGHGEGLGRFDIIDEFARLGATDYLALPIRTASGDVHVLSIWTSLAEGWTDAQVVVLSSVGPTVSLVVEAFESRRLSRTIVETYLGPRTGPRVLSGRIHRGESERIRAAIWFSDVRSFTTLTRRYGDEAIVSALDAWFELAVDCVHRNEGEVLKFMGDALLAIFPVKGDDWRRAVDCALDAAAELHLAEVAQSQRSRIPMQSGVGLHTGEVIYGNVGAPGRLDFTVIGEAVNAAARIASLCRTLDESTLVSRRFAETTERSFRVCGNHSLRGMAEPLELLAPNVNGART